MPDPPRGGSACSNCGEPLPAGVRICPNCGLRRSESAPRWQGGVGVLLAGLAMCGIAVGVFYVSCMLPGMANAGGVLFFVGLGSLGLALIGLVTMLVGLILTIVQAVRR
jgi:hypothetical protein